MVEPARYISNASLRIRRESRDPSRCRGGRDPGNDLGERSSPRTPARKRRKQHRHDRRRVRSRAAGGYRGSWFRSAAITGPHISTLVTRIARPRCPPGAMTPTNDQCLRLSPEIGLRMVSGRVLQFDQPTIRWCSRRSRRRNLLLCEHQHRASERGPRGRSRAYSPRLQTNCRGRRQRPPDRRASVAPRYQLRSTRAHR
jgi:hypothetical protein